MFVEGRRVRPADVDETDARTVLDAWPTATNEQIRDAIARGLRDQSFAVDDVRAEFERLRRLGVANLCSLKFAQATAGKRFLLYGYEIDPVFEKGRR